MNSGRDLYTPEREQVTLNCRGTLVNLSKPAIMGILNITPDSFFDGGKFTDISEIKDYAGRMIEEGATFLDMGGQSTRPGARLLSAGEEAERIIPAIEAVMSSFPEALVSIDTFYSEVARQAVAAGACMINDISAGSVSPDMFDTVADLKVPYVLMHMHGTPENMQQNPTYENVVTDVWQFLKSALHKLIEKGVNDVVIDPGIGFGKTQDHNFELLKHLGEFRLLGKPLLIGLSRKSIVCKTLKVKPENALNGTTALHMVALLNGARILRVHDVKEAKETIELYQQL